ncbi:MAG: c-type cytochrome [Methylovirgula sp.]
MNRLGSISKPSAVFAMIFVASVCVAETPVATVPKQVFEAKRTYCMTCHGVAAQGFRGVFPIPRLAGQQPQYIKNQLSAFIERRRMNPVMFRVAHVLSPTMIDGLAAYFATLNPKPLGGAPENLVAAGKVIFENGIPSQNVPPCASCHGPQAKGSDQFPRLAGQLNDYIINKLTNWTKERGQDPKKPDTSAIMAPIAHMLTTEQITEVAAYLSYLE